MPSPNNSTPQGQIESWRKALPSQINDSFHILSAGKLERILAFGIPADDLRTLIPKNSVSAKSNLSDLPKLVLFYGLGPSEENEGRDTFKVFVNTVKDHQILGAFLELEPLTESTLPNYLRKHSVQHLLTKSATHLNVNAQDVTSELIPPELEHFLSYAWKSCDTSRLVDQTEALHNGKRYRIERSIYDEQVYKMISELYDENNDNVLTILYLGIHPVIPNDSRIYPFGPIFQSFTPGTPLSTKDSDGNSVNSTDGEEPMHPVNFELSNPCPPSCDPPD